MEITLLGTGCPSVDCKRLGPSNLVRTKKTKILVDCGSGVTQRLHQLKVSSADIDALFLTHLHSDHVVDLYQLIISLSDQNIWDNHTPVLPIVHKTPCEIFLILNFFHFESFYFLLKSLSNIFTIEMYNTLIIVLYCFGI